MSCFGSTRTDFSTSNMSLASSTLMTAPSTCTISDADYETSDEQMLSPQIPDKVEAQIEPSSSNLRWSSSLLSSQSVSCLIDACEDIATSSSDAADKYAMSVKSDTYLNHQSKIISDFINDMRLQDEHEIEDVDSAPSGKDSSSSEQTEFFPASGNASDSPYGSIVDINIADSTTGIDAEITDEEHSDEECCRVVASEKALQRPVRLTLSETRHKIIENLAQVTSDKLFSKAPPLRYLDSGSASVSRVAEPPTAGVRRVTSMRRSSFQRCRGVESLLQIDYELQPLNLMLSRLLAEFRAMDLRGKLGHVEPDRGPSDESNFATGRSRRKEEEPDTCVQFLSQERLAAKEATSIAAQISRSCEDNCLAARFAADWTELSEKHPECSNETERNPRCHRGETRCTADDRRSQKVRSGEEEDFGSGAIRLMEIASTN